jgi:hypothetical protein
MIYPTKTALVIRVDLQSWQIANVAAFLSGGLAGTHPEMVGEPYRDGDGRLYTPMIREPVFIYGATSAELTRTHGRAVNRGIRFAIYTAPLFETTNDADNRANVAATATAALDLVGLGLHADRKIIDKIVGGLKFLS